MGKLDTTDIRSLFSKWKVEHRDLNDQVDRFRDWADAVAQSGVPKFGEAARQLSRLRERLLYHFAREKEMGHQLAEAYPEGSNEVAQSCKKAEQDHNQLMKELEGLIDRLSQLDPPFDSWEAAISEVGLFAQRLDEHEAYECEHIEWLGPLM
ncbi:hypothetical protein CA13_24440 [Planctomycetes bacterium CA13]|uniref:Hemerythrin-like domain-containing protein n=2 Tax=Novipirellula herctigrandis TaxID=2527986 RepID=A0A5C5Z229_9BACT|nr:hypothetical protein CA13_24440 [Planctomycetes bacterium CA13]